MEFRNAEVIKENVPERLPLIEKHCGDFPDEVKTKLLTISASTIRRYSKRARELGGRGRGYQQPVLAQFCGLKYRYAQPRFGMLRFQER